MGLAEPRASYAVLIGCSTYDSAALDDLPAVANNVARLAELLEDPTVWGLPPGHCLRLSQPSSAEQVLDTIRTAARRATDTLLVYYSGHGLIDPDFDSLLLTLPSSDVDRPYSSIAYDGVRREILNAGRRVNKMAILDCCYSGQAMTGGMSGAVTMAEQARIAGTYLLTASDANRQALSPPGEEHTAFTGELIRLLDEGLPGGGQLIEADRIYEHLVEELRAKGRPLPQQRSSNTGRTLAFVRNRYGIARTRPAAQAVAPVRRSVPQHLAHTLRARPQLIAEHSARLRDEDAAAAQELLTLAAALRPAQEVAALVWLLRGEDRGTDAATVLQAAGAEREPKDLAVCIRALRAMDDGDDAEQLTLLAARRDPEDVAATIRSLDTAGDTAEAHRLMTAAMRRARTTETILGLAGAFWSSEMDRHAERVLRAAVIDSPEETVRLADALLTIGRKENALDLYLLGRAAVVSRPTQLVHVLQMMDEAGRTTDAEELLRSASATPMTVPALTALCETLWAAGMGDRVLDVLSQAASVMPKEQVIDLADVLHAEGRDEAMLDLLRRSALSRPAAETVALVAALRGMGRPLDAHQLLTDAAGRPAEEVAALVTLLEGRDRDRVLAARRGTADSLLIGLVSALRAAGAEHLDIVDSWAALPVTEFLDMLRLLHQGGDHDLVPLALARLVHRDPALALTRLELLTRAGAQVDAAALRGLLRSAGSSVKDSVDELSAEALRAMVGRAGMPAEERSAVISTLSGAGLDGPLGTALADFVRGTSTTEVVQLLVHQHRNGHTAAAHAVVRGAGWMFPEMYRDFVYALVRAGLREYATYALECNAARLGPELARELASSLGVPAPVPPPPEPDASRPRSRRRRRG
ncbi:hypothetical protein AQ490_25255 [Wenjunlia vitaminophila]|uniref:Peptidase C14 caspase domain-containing protein n=1 Tax=Wenjunlia vitaminophila TaxID=76728 RepID=A0A0T6LQL3_WENVI|nr:caspase family protein [Wenjunlia vitaminophila]KRV48325.1 hypothetical protein AQ490_25255 [Wenjunlia vitaminophila]